MEFYFSTTFCNSAWNFGFNSQRDGILLEGNTSSRSTHRTFQFPTGWNSTTYAWYSAASWSRFNSQRDGILLEPILSLLSSLWVSIPNGMEFYFSSTSFRRLLISVSIPNGMEFYDRGVSYRATARRFQFPTGWNSTGALYQKILFYYSFNSQRDGILPTPVAVSPILPEVSIPNGMEFYFETTPIKLSESECFNSQRDGILLDDRNKDEQYEQVSIPNGMEFYYAIFRVNVRQRRVSIPNGMEFYLKILHAFGWLCPFQFPTGWNSTNVDETRPYRHCAVSIPNGMEFYFC